MLQLLATNPLLFILLAVVLILSLSIHEFSHALIADKLGDSTPRFMGRLTLNPLAHLDPIGTLLLFIAHFGWGKPVQISSINFKHPRRDSALVALAGPASNLVMAAIFSLLAHFVNAGSFFYAAFYIFVLYNLTLAFFNLLPIYPLDGYNIVYGFLPINLVMQWQQMQQYGLFILLILIVTGTTGFFITGPVDFLLKLLGF